MAETVLTWILNATDNASPKFDKLGNRVQSSGDKLKAWSKQAEIASAIALAAIVAFAKVSVDAYEKSQTAQDTLAAAFQRFPKLADTNIASLDKLNNKIAQKTVFDHNSAAAAEANLAQFDLTGKQIQKLLPLVADYAAKTGTDLPTAATAVGKALEGQTRALKTVGINYKSTKDAGKDFQNITGLLQAKVGGLAEKMGGTGAGKAKILENSFIALQEKIGKLLLPILEKLEGGLSKVVGWFNKNPAAVKTFAIILGVLAAAFVVLSVATWIANTALLANPITWIVLAVIALIAAIVLLITHWKQVSAFLLSVWKHVADFFVTIGKGIAKWWNDFWGGIFGFIKTVIKANFMAITTIFQTVHDTFVNIGKALSKWWNDFWNGLTSIAQGAFKTGFNFITSIVNDVIDAINTITQAIDTVGGAVGISVHIGKIPDLPKFARGGIALKPTLGIFGEAGPEALVPLPKGAKSLTGGGGLHIAVTLQGTNIGSSKEFQKAVQTGVIDGLRQGHISSTAIKNALGIA